MIQLVTSDIDTHARSQRTTSGGGNAQSGEAVRRRYLDYKGIDQVLEIIRKQAIAGQQDEVIQRLATQIVPSGLNEQRRTEKVFDWFRTNIRYQRDARNTEEIQSARRTVGRGAGDCEDHVILMAAMLSIVGVGSRYAVIRQSGFDDWNHIYLEYWDGFKWRTVDTGAPDEQVIRPGGGAPAAVLQRRTSILFEPSVADVAARTSTLGGPAGTDTPVIHDPGVIRVSVLSIREAPPEVTLEVNTWRISWAGISLDCAHPTIAVRRATTGQLLGHASVPGGVLEHCLKSIRIPLPGYTADEEVIFEVYAERGFFTGSKIDDIIDGSATPAYTSSPWRLADVPTVKPAGSPDFVQNLATAGNVLKWGTIAAGGAFLAWTALPVISTLRSRS